MSEEAYTSEWFASRADGMKTKILHAVALAEVFEPRSVIDVGCANGYMLLGWTTYDTTMRLLGLEKHAAAARESAPEEVRELIHEADAGTWKHPGVEYGKFDLTTCVEVAEHIPGAYSHVLVRGLCELSDTVFFTAARPGQTGDNHVNCQPPQYWIDLFDWLGYRLDMEPVEVWRQLIPEKTGRNPRRNAMCFRAT